MAEDLRRFLDTGPSRRGVPAWPSRPGGGAGATRPGPPWGSLPWRCSSGGWRRCLAIAAVRRAAGGGVRTSARMESALWQVDSRGNRGGFARHER